MRFLLSAQFIGQSRVADEFVAPAAALDNRLLDAKSLGGLPPCSVSYFIEVHQPGATIGLHGNGTANIRINLDCRTGAVERQVRSESNLRHTT
ncbi:hypothetical protein HUE56_06410 (plasmid) [Azospirillum oryzae]|uniref:Uncharacterized protein n=1 Tax=Azospirillum oryzae TaxID=286727 RepID=A0A6N1AF19_9PROT|nr:hypothetical protein [Azospirillum oryzae]KAA0588800.1 hypothetical protein FZ938_13150 [Azospirillum oryzae]QKS50146.1 hypothetical protein HUE56_06410 [Azospirillum oryzae]GLR80291.1 hypothetical protein GCM10007856_29690 [Azospirillum oryzae]